MNMQVTDWKAHYKAVQDRLFNVKKPTPVYTVPARLRLGCERYMEPIGPSPIVRDLLVLAPSMPTTKQTFARIRDAKLAEYGISLAMFNSPRRNELLCQCRREVWYEVSQQTGMSLPQIGRLSHRDHTTILHGIRREAEIRSGVTDPKLAAYREKYRARHRSNKAKREASA